VAAAQQQSRTVDKQKGFGDTAIAAVKSKDRVPVRQGRWKMEDAREKKGLGM
jgi:hypothetical protein